MMRTGTLPSVIAALVLAIAAGGPAAAQDLCANASGDTAIAACTRDIESGRFKGTSLALKYGNRGAEYSGKRDYDRAIADYNEAIRLAPQFANAYFNRCIAYDATDDFDRALADCTKAITLGPTPNSMDRGTVTTLNDARNMSDYYQQRGTVYQRMGNYDRAIADYNEALRRYPQNAKAMRNRGRAYEAKGDTQRAEDDYAAADRMK